MDKDNTTTESRRQRTHRGLILYRASFVLALLFLSTLATIVRHRVDGELDMLNHAAVHSESFGKRRLGTNTNSAAASIRSNSNITSAANQRETFLKKSLDIKASKASKIAEAAREFRAVQAVQASQEAQEVRANKEVQSYKKFQPAKEVEIAKEEATSLNNSTEVYFLNHKQLSMKDSFSASWLQTRDDFMTMPFDKIHVCEDAAFRAYDRKRRAKKQRMTLDWMDLSIEHLSKWWKTAKWNLEDPIAYDSAMLHLNTYMNQAIHYPVEATPTFHETMAVIAFQSFRNGHFPEREQGLTAVSLAATVESLRRAGFGRVTVGILLASDVIPVQNAFKVLLDIVEPNSTHVPKHSISHIGRMEVGYALVSSDQARTKSIGRNIPRATIMGLRDAFATSELPEVNRTAETIEHMQMWIGSNQPPSHWKYVYLTEPDSLLHTRPATLAGLKAELDKGTVLLPHRLQPTPHESDVMGMDKDQNFFLYQEDFPEVISLDPIHGRDVCCDENAGPDFKPGLPPHFEKCNGQFWYSCGFGKPLKGDATRHKRLTPYKLMRLSDTGSGLVSLAGSSQGRRCIPQKNTICRPASV